MFFQAADRARVHSFGGVELSNNKTVSTQQQQPDVFEELSDYLASGLFTDYSQVLAAQTTHSHTPAANGETHNNSLPAYFSAL